MSNITDKPWLVPGHMYQYDIGWLIDKLLSFEDELNTAIDLKTIHYADPLQWDITTQYSPNTVVIDPISGTAYMSKVAVPTGVQLDNTNYWIPIFNYNSIMDKIMDGVAFNDRENAAASKDIGVTDLVWFKGSLYRATRAISAGSRYIPGTNLTTATIADCLKQYYGTDRTAQVLNDTLTVSGDWTVSAGDASITADDITAHATQDMHVQIDGGSDVTVKGDETHTVTGASNVSRNGDVTETDYNNLTHSVGNTYKLTVPHLDVHADSVTLNKTVTDGEFFGTFDMTPDTTDLRHIMVSNDGSKFMNNKWGCASKGRIVIMGDSFAGDWQGFEEGSYATRLVKLLGADKYNIFSFGGGGFIAKDNEHSKNYLNCYKDYVEPALQSVKHEITLFIVQGGINDGTQNFDTEKTAVTEFLTYLQNSLPDACIVGVTNLGYARQAHDTVLGINGGFNNAGVRNTPFAFSWLLGRGALFASDELHPNAAGHEAIARMIRAFLYGADPVADDFGYWVTGGGGGTVVTPLGTGVSLKGSGKITTAVTKGSTYKLGNIPKMLAPSDYYATPIYTDAGLAYLTLDSNGALGIYAIDAASAGFGTWRFNIFIPFLT